MKKSTKWIAALIAIVAMGGVADAAFLTGGLPRIAAAGPNVYVVWSDTSSGPYQVYMKRSTDKGLTWKAKKSLSADLNSAIDQDLVVSGSSLFVVWVEALDTYRRIMFRISENRGATWQSPVQVAARLYSDGFAARPTIAVSGANIYLAWDEWKSSSSQIEFTKSTDNGRTWTEPQTVAQNPIRTVYSAVAADGQTVCISWIESVSGVGDQVMFQRSFDGGLTWFNIGRISNSTFAYGTRLALFGTIVSVLWIDGRSDRTGPCFRKSNDLGSTWLPISDLPDTPGYGSDPDLAYSGPWGYVVWSYEVNENRDIVFSRSNDAGATWSFIKPMSHSGKSFFPGVAATDSNICLTWWDFSGESPALRFRKSEDRGRRWGPIKKIR